MNPFGLFTSHPRSVRETYVGHMRTAESFAWRLVVAGFACAVHGLLPFLFERTASSTVRKLHARMEGRSDAG
jgi:hypothetical protein